MLPDKELSAWGPGHRIGPLPDASLVILLPLSSDKGLTHRQTVLLQLDNTIDIHNIQSYYPLYSAY